MIIEYVREGPVTQIVAETRNADIIYVLVGDLKIWLLLLEFFHDLPGDVARANAMFEPVVHSRGEHVVDAPELLQVAQSLKLLGVDDIPTKRW